MTYKTTRRDTFVWAACNWLLNNIATKEYRVFVTARLSLGRKEMDRILELEDVD